MLVTAPEDLAYAAGFIDGDGCVAARLRIRNGVRQYEMTIKASSTTPSVLRKLRGFLGGVICELSVRDGQSRKWEWSLYGRAAARFLANALPYFRLKREEAVLALVFQESLDVRGRCMRIPVALDVHTLRENLIGALRALKAPRLPAPLVHGRTLDDPVSTDVAYAAGFVDAEGTISIAPAGRSYGLKISVANTSQEVLESLEPQFGGRVYRTAMPAPYRTKYDWVICGAKAASFLRAIQPYLVVKREEAVIGLQLQESVDSMKHRRPGQRLTGAQLEHRGVLRNHLLALRRSPKEIPA